MEKLENYIHLETKNGFKILKENSPWHGPGIVNYEKNCVVLNLKYLTRQIESFDENALIGILYHEIGHLEYFKQYPVTRENFTEDYKAESEYYAFEYSLITLLNIANDGDAEPLKVLFEKISDRIKKIQRNDFEDENNSLSHINALQKISKSKIYSLCNQYLKAISI